MALNINHVQAADKTERGHNFRKDLFWLTPGADKGSVCAFAISIRTAVLVGLIQFGHNDGGAINDASRARGSLPGTGEETQEIDNLLTKQHEVVHSYGWYMRKMIVDTKAKGATPIVLSLTVRNIWKDGHVERGPGKFGRWAAEVASSQQVTFIDVTTLIADKYEELGEEKVRELFATDHTHTNPAGAELNASSVVIGLKMLKDKPVNRYLSAKGRAVESSHQ